MNLKYETQMKGNTITSTGISMDINHGKISSKFASAKYYDPEAKFGLIQDATHNFAEIF